MSKLSLFFALLIFGCSFGQSISKQVISPAGINFDNGSNKLSFSTGEVVVGSMTDEDATYQLGNGYYPSLNLSTLNTESPELQLQVKVFPNPTTEVIYITHPTESFFEVSITDVSGKQILQTANQKQQPLSLQNFTKGTYFISVTTKDSKQTNKELSSKLDMSVTAVYERIKKLEKAGVIDKYVALVNKQSIGRAFVAFCHIKLVKHSQELVNQFEKEVVTIDEVLEAYHLSGDYDYLLKVHVEDMDSFRKFMVSKLTNIDHIGSTHSMFVISEVKHTTAVNI